jgi:chitin disaccharide deacetylase
LRVKIYNYLRSMNKCTLTLAALFILSAHTLQAQKTLAERLGYSADSRLLIIHADDLAVAHAENQASTKAMDEGSVNSASVMVPCPWLGEVAAYAKKHPNHDLGLHLTVTSEWKHYKWGPVSNCASDCGLTDSLGHFYDNCQTFARETSPKTLEQELRAQVEKAISIGINPTHLDSHMGCLFFTDTTFFAIYQQIGRDYGIPTLVSRDILSQMPAGFQRAVKPTDIVLDQTLTASPDDYKNGMAKYYQRTLETLSPGVTCLLIHTAYDNAEMQGVSIDHPEWGAAWRQADFDFFTSADCKRILAERKIQLVTWREIGKLLKG